MAIVTRRVDYQDGATALRAFVAGCEVLFRIGAASPIAMRSRRFRRCTAGAGALAVAASG